MFQDTVQGFAATGAAKAKALSTNPLGYWIAAMMAGVYIGFAILLVFSLGSVIDPASRPLVMGASFGLALILVIFAGAELYTGLTMSMTVAALEKKVTPGEACAVLATSWLGNLAGALLLAALFVSAGGGAITHAPSGYLYAVTAAKAHGDALGLISKAILCNWLVCLAVWMAVRVTGDAGRMIAISWCLFAFVASGFEHSVANMTIFGVALFSAHPETITWGGMAWNLFFVTIGNTIAGGVFMAGAYWLASRGPRTALAAQAVPAE